MFDMGQSFESIIYWCRCASFLLRWEINFVAKLAFFPCNLDIMRYCDFITATLDRLVHTNTMTHQTFYARVSIFSALSSVLLIANSWLEEVSHQMRAPFHWLRRADVVHLRHPWHSSYAFPFPPLPFTHATWQRSCQPIRGHKSSTHYKSPKFCNRSGLFSMLAQERWFAEIIFAGHTWVCHKFS